MNVISKNELSNPKDNISTICKHYIAGTCASNLPFAPQLYSYHSILCSVWYPGFLDNLGLRVCQKKALVGDQKAGGNEMFPDNGSDG